MDGLDAIFLLIIAVLFSALVSVSIQKGDIESINKTLIQRAQRDSAEAAHYRKIIENQLIIYQNDTCR